MDLSIVIPAFNESESLPKLWEELKEVCTPWSYEVIVVDDGSTDGTFKWVQSMNEQEPNLHGIRLRRNCGKAAALSEGFKRVKGRYVITMDGDLQDNPIEIPAFVDKLDAGADMVSGWKKKRFDSLGKTLPSKFFNWVTRKVSGLDLNDFNCGFKGYRKEVVESVTLYGEMHRYIPVLAHWNGFRVEEHVVHHRPREFGHSKYGLSRLFHGLFDLITLVFLHKYTTRPLHMFGLFGLGFGFLGASLLCYFAGVWLYTGSLHVRPLLVGGMVSILLGVQIISMGLLGEMIVQRSIPEYPVGEDTTP
jgi:glycosyltransferase involved in cell wall biosynthesis